MSSSSSSPPASGSGSGSSEKETSRILARAAAAKTPEYPAVQQLWPASLTGGVLPMSLTGRFANERERLGPEFTDAERKWRIRWYKSQHLHSDEPIRVPELYTELRNPIRRFYKIPLDYVQFKVIKPVLGREWAFMIRQAVGKGSLMFVTSLLVWYNIKYNYHTWEKCWGVAVRQNRTPSLPGDANYPVVDPRPNPEDYNDFGFKSRNVFRNL